MKKQEKSQLTEEFKISKKSSVIPNTTRDLDNAVRILQRGGLIIFPTDTVYGIGCRWDNPIAVARVRQIKGTKQHLPILIDNLERAHNLAKFDQTAIHLSSKYWPGALTLILQSKKSYGKIGLRVPDSDLVRSIIRKLDAPIIGTSANFHGQKSATKYDELDKKLIDKVDFVIKGNCRLKQESTVVDATFNPPRILRRGAVLIR